MPAAALVPVVDAPALLLSSRRPTVRRRLLIADLHLGLGEEGSRDGLPASFSAPPLAEAILALARAHAARGVVIAGDVKHPIVGTPRALRPVLFDFFATLLGEGLSVDVVPGNHDVGIAPHLPREVALRASDGIVLDGVGIAHGHRWPGPRVLAAERLVLGHLHPGVRLAPSSERPTGKERCWVRLEVDARRRDGRPAPRPVRFRELIVLPAFNPLAGTEALNRERPRRGRSFLYHRFLARGTPRAYLLDGTDVGPIIRPRGAPPAGGARGSPPGP